MHSLNRDAPLRPSRDPARIQPFLQQITTLWEAQADELASPPEAKPPEATPPESAPPVAPIYMLRIGTLASQAFGTARALWDNLVPA